MAKRDRNETEEERAERKRAKKEAKKEAKKAKKKIAKKDKKDKKHKHHKHSKKSKSHSSDDHDLQKRSNLDHSHHRNYRRDGDDDDFNSQRSTGYKPGSLGPSPVSITKVVTVTSDTSTTIVPTSLPPITAANANMNIGTTTNTKTRENGNDSDSTSNPNSNGNGKNNSAAKGDNVVRKPIPLGQPIAISDLRALLDLKPKYTSSEQKRKHVLQQQRDRLFRGFEDGKLPEYLMPLDASSQHTASTSTNNE
uniref:Uncharacterized protein n=1 Tax=Craspedostauros australis TaxID=1486917 RepID=A0A7R9ZP20_9STRA